MNKQEARAEIKERILKLGEEILPLSESAERRLMELQEYQEAKSIMVYMPLLDEVDTLLILGDCLKMKKVYVPHTLENIIPAKIGIETTFILKKFNVFEPSVLKLEPYENIDLVIVPLRAFDRAKNRLGRGKGYYDRFLKDFKGKKIGLAFSVQEFPELPYEIHDIKLDKIVTDKEVID